MNLRDFVSDVLSGPLDLVAYEVTRKLIDLHPDRVVIEGSVGMFDLTAYARADRCQLITDSCIFNKSSVEFSRSGKELVDQPENAWFNVLWRGHLLDVLFLTWTEEGYRTRHYWIVAETRQVAEEFLRAVAAWDSEVSGEILVYDGGYWYKDRELFEAIKNSNIDNLILPHALKQEIREDLARFFAARDTYERYGIPWKRGILLIGPPGNGKTHAVKALINETRKACLYVKSFKACWGTEHDSICRVFKQARRTTPCIVVLEDLDSLIDKSNRSFFLNELDGFAENTGVVILATTNHPDQIDSAIIDRPSRFDRKYFFELPSRAGRRIYFERWQGSVDPDLRLPPDSLSKAAAMTDGFSFAYLKELCLSAMMSWMSDRTRPMEEVLFATAEILLKEVNRGEQSGKKRKSKRKKTMAASAGCEHWS